MILFGPFESEKRGRGAKHIHSVTSNHERSKQANGHNSYTGIQPIEIPDLYSKDLVERMRIHLTSAMDKKVLEIVESSEALESNPSSALKALVLNDAACPCLCLYLRLCSGINRNSWKNSYPFVQLAKEICHWKDHDVSRALIYEMAGDKSGSHFLQCLLHLAR